MTDATIGSIVRNLRIRNGWRQADLARRSRVSTSTVARIERGLLAGIALDRVRRVVAALGARLDNIVRWQGGDLERLLSARHSAMHEIAARKFAALPEWATVPELSFSIYGERGVIDIVAWHASSETLLIVELKTEIVDINELLAKADQRRRLGPAIVRGLAWRPAVVATWLLVADSRTNRRRLAAHRTVLRSAFPDDGRRVASWLRHPDGPLAALTFLTNSQEVSVRTSLAPPKRVRVRRSRLARAARS